MNRLWCFGDSFTAGHGLNFDEFNREGCLNYEGSFYNFDDNSNIWHRDPYFKKYKDYKHSYKDKIFAKLFSNYLNYELINEGESGCSNDRIIHQIIKNINSFKSDDIILIGLTSYLRVIVPSKFGMGGAGATNVDEDVHKCYVKHGPRSSEKLVEKVTEYIYDVLMPNEDILEAYYLNLFKSVRDLILPKVKRVVLWDHHHWHRFENIHDWKRIGDRHWSPKGHEQFNNFLIENYEKNNDILIQNKYRSLI